MQHVLLSDFFPVLFNKHSFVPGSAWKHQFTTISAFLLLIPHSLTLLYNIHPWNLPRQGYFKTQDKDFLIFQDKCPPYWTDIQKCFPTNVWPQRESSLSQTVGVCLRCRGQIPPSLLHEKRAARQWGVSSTITTQLDAWQMKMRQQEDQNCCIICVSNISHPACISQDGSNEIDQVNTQSQYTLQSEHSLRTIPGIVNSSLFSESLMHRFSSIAYGKSYPSAPREFNNTKMTRCTTR